MLVSTKSRVSWSATPNLYRKCHVTVIVSSCELVRGRPPGFLALLPTTENTQDTVSFRVLDALPATYSLFSLFLEGENVVYVDSKEVLCRSVMYL